MTIKQYHKLIFLLLTIPMLKLFLWTEYKEINQPEFLTNQYNYLDVKILIIIPCSIEDFDSRHRSRTTFSLCSMYNSSFPIAIRFFVANTSSSSMTKDKWNLFHLEMLKFHDIIWDKGLIDSYKNLSLKMIRALRWSEIHFPNIWFLLRMDVNGFLSLHNLLAFLSNLMITEFDEEIYYKNPPSLLIGYANYNLKPNRIKKKAWYVPISEYPYDQFPRHNSGNFYILNRQVISMIVRNFSNFYETKYCRTANLTELSTTICSLVRPILTMEDVLINGILVEHITRLHFIDIYDHLCFRCKEKVKYGNGKIYSYPILDFTHHKVTDCLTLSEKLESFPYPLISPTE